MSALSVCLAGIDGVFVVEAFADGEAFDDFVAHGVRSVSGYTGGTPGDMT